MTSTNQPAAILERYALFDAIARGGMATVHIARLVGAAGFSKTVAIKRMHEHLASNAQFVNMFVDEARLAGRLQHPHVVNVMDVVASEGEAFLVMEYVHGESLSSLMKQAGQSGEGIPPQLAVQILRGALEGLHAAHEATSQKGEPMHLVHRDVSPQNILVGVDGIARVLDFGIAKAVGRLQDSSTGHVKGKAAYMAPEQVSGQPVDRRTDIYAAGVVLWECLAGRRLFTGENSAEIIYRVLEEDIPGLDEVTEGLDPNLIEAVARATSRHSRERYATAREFALALDACCPVLPTRAVGTWVKELGGDALSARAARVHEIEALESEWATDSSPLAINEGRRSPIPHSYIAAEQDAATVADGFTAEGLAVLPPSSSPAARRWRYPLLGLFLCSIALGAFLLFRSSDPRQTANPAVDVLPTSAAENASEIDKTAESAQAEPETAPEPEPVEEPATPANESEIPPALPQPKITPQASAAAQVSPAPQPRPARPRPPPAPKRAEDLFSRE